MLDLHPRGAPPDESGLRWPTITVISFADSVDQLTIKGVASTSFTLARLDA